MKSQTSLKMGHVWSKTRSLVIITVQVSDSRAIVALLFKGEFDTKGEFYVNGWKFFKLVENTVGKGEISRYKQFLFLPLFSKDLYCRHVKTRACLGKSKSPNIKLTIFPDNKILDSTKVKECADDKIIVA